MKLLHLAFALFVSATLAGCGGPGTAPAPAQSEVAQAVQSRVTSLLEFLKKSPKNAAQEIAIARESLESYATNHKGKFVDVAEAAKELQGLYENKAPAAQIEAGQKKLADAAAATGS